ncbi:MAG TPA: LamG-like jellyroll fold domain-containing protein [Candidatus Polarisedimenticolia bacterium]|nr:LamG-like jellyroll fold domain-containing protein [Candidatus Polarisedimenticolia bacterium]
MQRVHVPLALLALACLLIHTGSSSAQSLPPFPGGFLEKASSTEVRPRLSASTLSSLLPQRGPFTFPAPWSTGAARITNGSDCGGTDCVLPVGYSYWRNTNNHAGSDTMLIFLTLSAARGGTGPTLFSYNKLTEEVRNLGPLFDASSPLRSATGEGWYFSATRPTALYLNSGSRLLRHDVLQRTTETVYDAASQFGGGIYIWQMHSSDDDKVHIATVRSSSTSAMLGCLAYHEEPKRFSYYPARGRLDECHLDKSGRWMVMLDNVDGAYGEDNRIVDLSTGTERLLLDQQGAAGHADVGHGYMVNEDDWNSLPGAVRLWRLDTLTSSLVYHMTDWSVDVGHITHGNGRPGAAPEQQFACSSNASRPSMPRANEVVCFRLDTSRDVLVVAPVMTDLDAPGGGDDYSKDPKGNLDVTGQYFVWTSNAGTGRLDAFLVKVPAHRLMGAQDVTPPTAAVVSPADGARVSGMIPVTASASDDVGVAGVQLRLDGLSLGLEMPAEPYSLAWNTTSVPNGSHTLSAAVRDAAGNASVSPSITVIVDNPAVPPVITGPAANGLSSSSAMVTWTTDKPSDSQVEYGTTTGYGTLTPLRTEMTVSHSETLSGLQAGTTYHYRVRSRDAQGLLSVSAGSTFTTLPAPNLSTGLVGYWKFDDSGPTIIDFSGSGHHGTLMNGARRGGGRSGQGVVLDGVDDFVDIPHRAALDAFPLSMSLWFKTNATGLAGILNKYLPSSFDGYQLFVNGGSLCAWYFKDASNNVYDGSSCTLPAAGFSDGQWHHVVFVADGAGGSLYVDGVLRGTRPWTGKPGPATTGQGLSLGRYPGTARPYFSGALDEVRLYNRALAPQEAAALHAALAASPADTAPPSIGSVQVRETTSTSATITWATSEPADTQVEYGATAAYGAATALDPSLTTFHRAILTGLAPGSAHHFRVRSRDASGNLGLSADLSFTTLSGEESVDQEVIWTEVRNCGITGSAIEKIAGQEGLDDAGATSLQQAAAGDASLEFRIEEASRLRFFGLAGTSAGPRAGDLAFAIRIQAGIAEVRENGAWRADTAAAPGDTFRIELKGGIVSYSRNGSIFHSGAAGSPPYPMAGRALILDLGGGASKVRIGLGS